MNLEVMKARYDASIYHPSIDYRNKDSLKNLNSIKPLLQNIITTNTKTLDLGCNCGKYSFFMESLGAIVTGVDFSITALNFANEIKADLHSNCNFVEDNILNLHFADNSFDLVLFPLNIVEFNYDDIELLCKELKNILCPGGLFCLTMQDGIKRIEDFKDSTKSYDASTGIHKAFHKIPGKGTYEYQTYFWTLAFAKHVIGKHFTLINEVEFEHNRYWLQFKNTK